MNRVKNPLLSKPLYYFELPAELLDSLVLRKSSAVTLESTDSEASKDETDRGSSSNGPHISNPVIGNTESDTTKSCLTCGELHFTTVQEQRQHSKTDWHRYNLKRQLLNQGKPVTEREFEDLIADLTDSISGSDHNSSSDSEGDPTNRVDQLLKKHKLDDDESDEDMVISKSAIGRFPLLWFESRLLENTQLGMYRALFRSIDGEDVISQIKTAQVASEDVKRCWTLIMVGGGHFAAMVVRLKPKIVQKERQVEVIAQKTFHRYTTRRKQGGSQSAKDQSKGKAMSAGANLRRYNESALQEEIRELLDKWREYLDESELIFVRANGFSRRIVFGYDGAPLMRADLRVRSFPFMTRRPTHNELLRCFVELTRIKISHFTHEALLEQEAAIIAQTLQRKQPKFKKQVAESAIPKTPKQVITKEQESQRQGVRKLIDLCRKGKLDLLSNYMEKHGYRGGVIFIPGHANTPQGVEVLEDSPIPRLTPTLLHLAAASGHADIVTFLLQDEECDPTIQNSTQKTAYEMSSDRNTRNAFRKAMAIYPDKCDWVKGAKVPSALTKEMEEEQNEKKSEWRKKERDRKREEEQLRKEEKVRIQKEEDMRALELVSKKKVTTSNVTKPTMGPQKLGGGPSMTQAVINTAGLSDEMRMKIEREKRARAIEARLKKSSG